MNASLVGDAFTSGRVADDAPSAPPSGAINLARKRFSRRFDLSTREQGSRVDEAELIAKWVGAVKTSFPPRLCFNLPENGAVRLFSNPGIAGLEIVHREVHMVRIRLSVPSVAIGTWIKTREDGSATIEVMPSRRDPHSGFFQDSRIEHCCLIDAGYWNDHAEQAGRRHI
jgi:hypothetical protein